MATVAALRPREPPTLERIQTPSVLCCMCGIPIIWNQKAMCVSCAQTLVSITDDVAKVGFISSCGNCGKYMDSAKHWIACQPDSKELLGICLKRLKGLNRVNIIDAEFTFTDPQSKRLQVKVLIEDEPYTGLVLQQEMTAELTVNSGQCPSCAKNSKLISQNISWTAVVQVRQKVLHKRIFFLLEQLILKHQAHTQTVAVSDAPDGMDFFFMERRHAMKFNEFLMSVLPARKTNGGSCNTRVLSEDFKNNEATLKHAFSLEVAPVCKYDLLCLHPRQHAACGALGPVVLVTSVTASIHLLDIARMRVADLKSETFFHNPRYSIMTLSQAVEYVVLDVETTGVWHGRWEQGEVTLARCSDLGVNDKTCVALTHLAGSLEAGDTVLAYDLASAVYNEACTKEWPEKRLGMPEVVVVKKVLRPRHSRRLWTLKTLTREMVMTKASTSSPKAKQSAQEYERFLDEVEGDAWLQQSISIYKDPEAWRVDADGVARSNVKDLELDDGLAQDSEEDVGVPTSLMLDNLLLGEDRKEELGRDLGRGSPDLEG